MGNTPKNRIFWLFWTIVHKKTSLFNKKREKCFGRKGLGIRDWGLGAMSNEK
jgi:hypothetical protein